MTHGISIVIHDKYFNIIEMVNFHRTVFIKKVEMYTQINLPNNRTCTIYTGFDL